MARYKHAGLGLEIQMRGEDDILGGALSCAIWTATDDDGEAMDVHGCSIHDFDDVSVAELNYHLGLFIVAAAHLLPHLPRGYRFSQLGHDFWLTCQGHGTGFWDRDDLKEDGLGDKLTAICKERFSHVEHWTVIDDPDNADGLSLDGWQSMAIAQGRYTPLTAVRSQTPLADWQYDAQQEGRYQS